ELRLGVHARLRREQEILVALLGVGLVRALADEDAAVEDGARALVEDALVVLPARAVRLTVVDERVRVGVLPRADEVEAIHAALRALAAEDDLDAVPRELRAQRHRRQLV